MKKKYRRAVCKCLIWLIKPFWWIFMAMASPFFVVTWMCPQDWEHWLCKKFKTYDYDPD